MIFWEGNRLGTFETMLPKLKPRCMTGQNDVGKFRIPASAALPPPIRSYSPSAACLEPLNLCLLFAHDNYSSYLTGY